MKNEYSIMILNKTTSRYAHITAKINDLQLGVLLDAVRNAVLAADKSATVNLGGSEQ